MMLVVVLVIVCVFAVAVLLIVASGSGKVSKSEAVLSAMDLSPDITKSRSGDGGGDFQKDVQFSAIPWFNQWLLKFELAPRLRILLYQANLKWTSGKILLLCCACFILPAYLVYWRTDQLLIALPVGLGGAYAPFAFLKFRRNLRFSKFEQQLPEALDLMVNGLRAGHSFNAALGLVSRECADPVRSEFKLCFDEQNFGLELGTAMENLNVRVPIPDLQIATTAILIQKETGGNLAEVLNNTASVIRERYRLKKQVQVHTAHGRMTAWVITILPFAILLASYLGNPVMASLLWTTPMGVNLLKTGAVGMVVGTLIINKIVNMEV
jgi:tight adherence protein B